MSKTSGKNHTQSQMDHHANQGDPNNPANKAAKDNRSNQMNPNNKEFTNFKGFPMTYGHVSIGAFFAIFGVFGASSLEKKKLPRKRLTIICFIFGEMRMHKLTDQQYEEYQRLCYTRDHGRILTPDGLRVVCAGFDNDPEAIGKHMLETLAKFQAEER